MVPPSCTSCTAVYAQCKTESVQYKNSSGSDLYGVEDTCAYLDHGGFFRKLPMEIVEAGIIDGCSKSKAFYKLILPISQPGIVSAALLSAVYVWNDYLVSSSFYYSKQRRK